MLSYTLYLLAQDPVAADPSVEPQPGIDAPAPATAAPATESAQPEPPPAQDQAEAKARLERVERDNAELRARLDDMDVSQAETSRRVDGLLPLTGRIGGYIDAGFFWAAGGGSGIRSDIGNLVFPEYDGRVPDSWVFMGDPLSTAINSRGEPADTGDSRAVAFDSIDSRGKASFALNALNLSLFTGVGRHVTVHGLVDFAPRNRDVSDPDGVALGDFVDVKLGYMTYMAPVRRWDLELSVGKIDPVFGYEYRVQESPDRTTVTPSLLCRYTCGRPIGLKARAKFLPRRSLVVALSVTNGSSMTEGFGLHDEIDRNNFKTLAGRTSFVLPVGAGLELGASGSFGAQDVQAEDNVYHWQAGADLHLDWRGIELTGEFVKGRAPGRTTVGEENCSAAPCLRYTGAYGLFGYRALNWLMPYVRADWRDALHESGASFVYAAKLVRITPGVRFELGTHVILKLEYTHNRELGPIPQFPNDVATSSVVAHF